MTCIPALPSILEGKRAATEIMFPNGSLHLVERIYKGTALTDYINKLAGFAIDRAVALGLAERREPKKVRVLETGAGTASTTAFVASALERHAGRIEYIYSDVSPGFEAHFRKHFAQRFPFMRFTTVDLERGLAEQGINSGSADVVLAANALHVSSSLQQGLQLIKGILAPNGLLALIEVTKATVFNTLTYGLLDGWWHFQDDHRRLPNAPLLSREMWKRTLTEEGFSKVASEEELRMVAAGDLLTLLLAENNNRVAGVNLRSRQTGPKTTLVQADDHNGPASSLGQEQPPTSAPPGESDLPGDCEDLQAHVEAQAAGGLQKALWLEASYFSIGTPFQDLGIDSIVSVEIVEGLNQVLGTQLRPVDLFNHPNIRSLSEQIVSTHSSAMREFVGRQATWPEPLPPDAEPTPTVATKTTARLGSDSSDSNLDLLVPIAVVGMSARFPDSRDLNEFCANLDAGKDLITEVPANLWSLAEFYQTEPRAPGRSYSKWGGFLSDIDLFDRLFFGISPHEAELMEPDHRLFLMESWKALEDAGYGSSELNGKRCAVFAGCVGDNYIDILRAANRDKEAFSFIGTSPAILSARIAYHLNLKGPSLTLDTACSSTGVAIHLACESLQLRTSDMALAGGVSIMNTPQLYIWLSQTGMLSPEGKCKTFGDEADGFVPGEAVVVLVLKRLTDATRDGDHVYGIIRGSGVNQDGKTNGITAPSGPSQTALETEVYHRYSIDPGTISYVECHGTGTKLGDPIEVEALTKAFRQFTDKTGFCRIGSAKTNIGHTLLASAGAGVVKVLLALQ